ncbi:protoporphyrinogen oxidase [Pseudonocardia eucalypti]|uniref:Protoporphyrinogen oxidase n=1 Tax=Pseudonocardia eucalypti TaxID=648755 RepID=A0ABP9PPD4_9PSEU|nr:oxygen-dependent protoporphyrinogen oxidase [Pseudonocardia eucalypti]
MTLNGLPMAVIGSGPAGLGAAWRLREAGHPVTVFERNGQLGGRMRTVRRDGFQVEDGPSQIAGSYTRFVQIMRESGLGDQLIPASTVLAMLDSGGTQHNFAVQRIHLDMLKTRLIGLRDKLDLAKITVDVLRYRNRLDVEDLSKLPELDGMSAEQYGRRRFGDGVYDNFVDPVIRGFVGTAPSTVAAADLVWVFATFMKLQRYHAIRDGMQAYAEQLGRFFDTRCNAEVTAVDERADEVEVSWRDAEGGQHSQSFAGVVVATLPKGAAKIHNGLDAWRRDFLATKVDNATIVQAHVALDSPPASSASMVYSTEVSNQTKVLAVNLEHNKAPGRVPEGKAIATIFGSNDWSKRVLEEEDDDLLVKELIDAAEPMVPGIGDGVRFTQLTRWPYSWAKSYPGYWSGMREFNRLSAQNDRLVRLAGDYFCVTSLNVATASGERAARQLIDVRER